MIMSKQTVYNPILINKDNLCDVTSGMVETTEVNAITIILAHIVSFQLSASQANQALDSLIFSDLIYFSSRTTQTPIRMSHNYVMLLLIFFVEGTADADLSETSPVLTMFIESPPSTCASI